MSEFGQLIDPYRVAPAQGDLLDYNRFYQQQEIVNKMREDAQLGQMTRSFITQQLGLPDGVDPFAIQQHQIAGNADQRAQAAEGRNAQEWQQMQQFGQNFPQQVQQQYQGQQMSPLVQALINSGGGAFGAKTLAGALAPMQQNSDEMSMRQRLSEMQLQGQKDINAANNQSEIERQRIANEGALGRVQEELKARQGAQTNSAQQISQAYQQFLKTGDPSALYGLAPDLMRDEMFGAQVSDVQKRIGDQKAQEGVNTATEAARKRAAEMAGAQGQSLTPAQQLSIQQTLVDRFVNGKTPADRQEQLINISRGGSKELVAAVKQLIGQEYDAAYNERIRREQGKRFNEARSKAENPLMHYIGKLLPDQR